MDVPGRTRAWVPVPAEDGGLKLGRWLLLEGDRHAVTGALLSVTFVSILAAGTIWTFEIRRLLTETGAVQTVLNTFMSGVILLVSIVVSINSIVLSYDITSLSSQEERVEGAVRFRRELSQMTDAERSPTNPDSFLRLMAQVIRERAQGLQEIAGGAEQEFAAEIEEHVESVVDTAERLERSLEEAGGAEFGVLWIGLEADYGPIVDRSRMLSTTYSGSLSEDATGQFEELIRAFELFATGRQYFKTLYYNREISELSRTLLVISLPAILVTATAILAINAGLFPTGRIFGFPQLLLYVAATITVALAPFIVLMSFMLRVATVSLRTAAAGPFALRS